MLINEAPVKVDPENGCEDIHSFSNRQTLDNKVFNPHKLEAVSSKVRVCK